MLVPLAGLISADAAYIYMNKVDVPTTIESFMKADKNTQIAVGSLAGMYMCVFIVLLI